MNDSPTRSTRPPVVFLSHASEDKALARRIATGLLEDGIEVFFDEWEIHSGDSIREKIDAGLGRCTHFVALLTPTSIAKAWVGAEMDAAFVRKVEGECRFIPLRHGLPPSAMPPLLRGLLSPHIDEFEKDLASLIDDIREVTRRPAVARSMERDNLPATEMGLSPAAAAIVKLIVEKSEHGLKLDPQLHPDDVRRGTGLSDEAISEGVEELIERGVVEVSNEIRPRPLGFAVLYPQEHLFAIFDRFFTGHDPVADALQLASDLLNEEKIDVQLDPRKLAERYNWTPRRLNSAIISLSLVGGAKILHALGTAPYCCASLWLTSKARRFVRAHDQPGAVLGLVHAKRAEILEITKRNKGFNPRIFGSSLRGDRHADSDIDLLVSLKPQASLMDIVKMQAELKDLLQMPVDVIDEGSLHRRIRDRVLAEARPI